MIRVEKRLVREAFSRAASSYDDVAILQREIADRMLERLELFSLQPLQILDLGAGTGYACQWLLKKYPGARIIALDCAQPMLQIARKRGSWRRRPRCICGDMDQLPLASGQVDLIFSSTTLQWSNDLRHTLGELRRVLKPGGLLIFSTFGPDTLSELRNAWATVDGFSHANRFLDIHDVGDAMTANGFSLPVLDVDRLTLTYQRVEDLMGDLKRLGAHNVTEQRNRGLTGKARLEAFKAAYEGYRRNGTLPASYEVIHAHAWAAEQPAPRVATVPLEALQRSPR